MTWFNPDLSNKTPDPFEMENYSERNLQIIQDAMQELGVSDCEEIPAAIRLLKQRAQQKLHPTPESQASSQAVVNADNFSQSDSESKPAQARVAQPVLRHLKG